MNNIKSRDRIILEVEEAFAEGERTKDFSLYEELKKKYWVRELWEIEDDKELSKNII